MRDAFESNSTTVFERIKLFESISTRRFAVFDSSASMRKTFDPRVVSRLDARPSSALARPSRLVVRAAFAMRLLSKFVTRMWLDKRLVVFTEMRKLLS